MPDKIVFYVVVALMTAGVLFSYSLSIFVAIKLGGGEFSFMMKQLIFAVMSIVTIWFISRLDPDRWLHKIGMLLFVFGFIAMVMMNFLPKTYVPEIGGASRWIRIFGFSIAPVEFFKIGFVYFLAWSMSRKLDNTTKHFQDEFKIFFPYIAVFIISIFFIAVMQKDLGQSVVLGTTFVVLSYLAGGSGKLVFRTILGFLIIFVVVTVAFPHRIERIMSWWGTVQKSIASLFPNSVGSQLIVEDASQPYQVTQSLSAINNGGFWGEGLGNGILKYGFLPEVHTDFVLEGVAEELGFFSIFVIFFLFALLLQRILKIANRSSDKVFFLFNVGIAMIIGTTLLINTYGSTGLIPMKGLPVPFLSYGGSSMLALSVGIGMVLMVSKSVYRSSQQESVTPPIGVEYEQRDFVDNSRERDQREDLWQDESANFSQNWYHGQENRKEKSDRDDYPIEEYHQQNRTEEPYFRSSRRSNSLFRNSEREEIDLLEEDDKKVDRDNISHPEF
jgi:cell division protein FtsW